MKKLISHAKTRINIQKLSAKWNKPDTKLYTMGFYFCDILKNTKLECQQAPKCLSDQMPAPRPTLKPAHSPSTLPLPYTLSFQAGASQDRNPLRAHLPPIASWGLWTEPYWFSKLDVLAAHLLDADLKSGGFPLWSLNLLFLSEKPSLQVYDSLGDCSLLERITNNLSPKFHGLFFHGWSMNHKEQQMHLGHKHDSFDERGKR